MAGTHVYIDGLNFYYGAVRGTPYKWLDLEAFVRAQLPGESIANIRYFTAPVKQQFPGDRAHERQNAYLRALKSNPLIEVGMGHFRVDQKWRAIADRDNHLRDQFRPYLRPLSVVRWIFQDAVRRRTDHATKVRVVISEEKGSDVNLATYLIWDALTGRSADAVVISNDSDLAEAVRLTVQHGVPVTVINPSRNPTSGHLTRVATQTTRLDLGPLADCQLSETVILPGSKRKQVHRPKEW